MESQNVMEFEVAVLRSGEVLPVAVESLTVTEVNGQRSFIIKVRRELTVSLRSYTIAYCFREESVESVSDMSAFRRKTHSDESINTESVMFFTGRLPERLEVKGCGAYISEIVYADGSVRRFSNTDFVTPGAYAEETFDDFDDGIEWAENAEDYAALLSGSSEADYTSTPFADAPAYEAGGNIPGAYGTPAATYPGNDEIPRASVSGNSDGFGPAESFGPTGGPGPATSSTFPRNPGSSVSDDGTKTIRISGTDTLAASGFPAAQNEGKVQKKTGKKPRNKQKTIRIAIIAGGTLSLALVLTFGLIIFSKSGKAATVEELIGEGRYTEAYKIAESYDSLRTETARRAMEHYLETGDMKNAYVFAYLAGDASGVTDIALEKLSALGEDALGSDIFSVALKAEDKGRLDEAIDSLASSLANEDKYEKAMSAALFIEDDARRSERSGSIFYRGISHYTSKGQYDAAAALIKRYGSTRSYDGAVDETTVTDAITYCAQNGDSASAVLLAKYFGRDYSGIDIAPADESVRDSVGAIYPLLTDAQRRAYHASPLAYCKEAFQIKDGVIEGTDVTDALSVDTYEFRTAVLHTDGHVTMLANGGHNETDSIPAELRAVQVVCGLHHTVALRADGTCAAFGSNDYGQCNVAEWTDVVALAAGRYFTLGLRSDGTVVACGANLEGQCNVADYRNVVDIAACDQTAMLMFADGTLHAQGDVTMGMYALNSFENVAAVSCRANTAVVRFEDGTYRIVCASDSSSAGDAANLAGATYFCAGSTSVAYIDGDGNLQIMGDGAPKR